MKELFNILRLEMQLQAAGVDAALATVVRVQGSSYRRPGARMLIGGHGQTAGGVSGGCLERDVVLRAGGVMESRQPVLVTYDTASDFDRLDLDGGAGGGAGGGLNLGCGGSIDVLIEPLRTAAGVQLIDWLTASQNARRALVTVLSKEHPLAPLGTHMAVLESGEIEGRLVDADATHFIAAQAQLALLANRSRTVGAEAANPAVFVESLNPPLSLFIFGAGNDAVPLAAFAKALGWRVTVVDVRSSPLVLGPGWEVDSHIRCGVAQVMDRVRVDPSAAAVVMTHNFGHDRRLIEWLAPMSLRYLGVLGPRHRTDQLLGDMYPEDLRSPVGLDIGADNPEEVALAIVAEITATLHGRSGASLSEHGGPIHVVDDRT